MNEIVKEMETYVMMAILVRVHANPTHVNVQFLFGIFFQFFLSIISD